MYTIPSNLTIVHIPSAPVPKENTRKYVTTPMCTRDVYHEAQWCTLGAPRVPFRENGLVSEWCVVWRDGVLRCRPVPRSKDHDRRVGTEYASRESQSSRRSLRPATSGVDRSTSRVRLGSVTWSGRLWSGLVPRDTSPVSHVSQRSRCKVRKP